MANMSHCRFSNTLEDLEECYESFDDIGEDTNPEELKSRLKIIKLCGQIWEEFFDELE